jgi:hypothetical protein
MGVCFNTESCKTTASSFDKVTFDTMAATNGDPGIVNTLNTANPVRDWNAVYIPYCTGDVHAGSSTASVPNGGPANQSFVGYNNVGHYMRRIVPTFPGLTKVLVVGISSGGFGALFNYDRIARDFCPIPVVLIDDSAPPMSDAYVSPCLQSRLRMLWNVDAALPEGCKNASAPNGGGIVNIITCLGDKYAAGRLGIISSDQDPTVAGLYGYNCMNLDGTPSPLPAMTYSEGLYELRSAYMTSPAWGSYFVNSPSHVYLGTDAFYNTTVATVSLTSWVTDMVSGAPARDVP